MAKGSSGSSKGGQHVGFKKLEQKFQREGKSDPAGLAADIGRAKYGKKQFQDMAAEARKRAGVKHKAP